MGFLEKIKVKTMGSDEDYDDGIYRPNDDDDADMIPRRSSARPHTEISGSAAIELKVVRPDSYSDVTEIADHLLNHRTVVLNLEATNREVAKRLIDFLAGVAYSIDGQLKNVANNTYIITPSNVDVADSQRAASAEARRAPVGQPAPAASLTSDTLF